MGVPFCVPNRSAEDRGQDRIWLFNSKSDDILLKMKPLIKSRAIGAALGGYLLVAGPLSAYAAEQFGTFNGELIVKALADGRDLELTHPFSFTDPAGRLWSVPTGARVNGASIPKAFWSLIGGPFEDKYREASVVHDHYCDERSAQWEDVHLVFYNGMRARGVGSIKAKLMYGAVYAFGPRWIKSEAGQAGLISGRPVLLDVAKESIVKYISENDPSIESIRELSDQIAKIENVEQLEKILYENVGCTPILDGNLDASTPSRTIILCGMSPISKKNAAKKNLSVLKYHIQSLVHTQATYLLPVIDDYVRFGGDERWEEVKKWSYDVNGLVKIGLRSALDVDVVGKNGPRYDADNLLGLLGTRVVMLRPILTGPKMSAPQMEEWVRKYRALFSQLQYRLVGLEEHISTLE